jgi:L-gulono-1,4-lactone dehydrogenase
VSPILRRRLPRFLLRRTWRNRTGNQSCDPLRRYSPSSIEELAEIVAEAEMLGATVRAVGSGHSWSDAALTPGFLVEPKGLARPLELEADLLRDGVDPGPLMRVEAGMRVRELNAHLASKGLALSQMGGYDAQTVAGVVSTSTHGSGIALGPFPDFVRSLDMVASGGAINRIEPADGPTDPQAFAGRYPDRRLVQDDRFFDAALVGIGCLGLIHSLMLEVRAAYWLTEVRTASTWPQVRADLEAGEVLRRNRHYEVYLNPYGERRCLVTTRNPTEKRGRGRGRRRNSIPEFLALLPITPHLINLIVDLWPSLTPRLLDRALSALADEEFTSDSYKVLNIGTANLLPAYSSEIGVPVDERGFHVQAVERIFEIADRHREVGSIYHTSPIALRFVRASRACLSMMEGRDTMMIELIQATRTEGGVELLGAYEEALYELEGRPHWGQVNWLTGGGQRVGSLYPRLGEWLDVQRELNRTGVFDGPLSRRTGIACR